MDEDENRSLLAAYLPADEPAVTALPDLVQRAGTVRRRRRAVVGSAASVAAVLAASVVAVTLTRDGGGAAPPSVPAPVSAAVRPGPPTVAPTVAPRSPAPAAGPCAEENRSNDPGARSWATWVASTLKVTVKPSAVEWFRMCQLDMGYTVIPAHVQNHAEFALPIAGGGTDNLTAATDRFERLPDQYKTPCKDDLITQHVVCKQRKLPDGSTLVQRDFYDILIYGDPNDPAAKRDKQAVRDATRIYPDGRTVTAGLVYNAPAKAKASFDRHVLSLAQLAALVSDPGALTHFPRR